MNKFGFESLLFEFIFGKTNLIEEKKYFGEKEILPDKDKHLARF
jgi:hypothetical protein